MPNLTVAIVQICVCMQWCLYVYVCMVSKNAKVGKLALIEVGITNVIFFLTFLVLTVLWCLQETGTVSSYITWLLIAISIPLALTLTSLATLFAIHLPLSFMIAYACCKHQRQKSIYDVTIDQSTDRHQPSSTTWDSPHSSADNEIIYLSCVTSNNQTMAATLKL